MTEFFKTNTPPVLTTSFTFSPSSPQVNQQVTFTATASGGTAPYTFSWSFGDGTNGNGATVTHTYVKAGSYIVALTTKDSGSPQQTATAQQSLTVTNPPPPLTSSFSYRPTSPQITQQVTFSGSASGVTSPYSFSWSFGDGLNGAGATVSHAYSEAGTFTVILTVKEGGIPQQTATSQQSVTITSPPPTLTASFTYNPSSPQVGQQITFTAFASGGTAPYTYSWIFGDGSTGTGATVTHSYSSAGTFTVILKVTDSGSPRQGSNSQQSLTVVSSPPALSASLSYSPTSPQAGQTITFTGSASGGASPYTYSWNFGDGSTGTGASSTHTDSSSVTFTV